MMTGIEHLAPLHDGHLRSIRVDETCHTLVVECVRLDGRAVIASLTAVDDLCANNVRLGNIILFAEVFDSVDSLGPTLLHGLAQSEREEVVAAYLRRLGGRPNRPRFFVIQSSYGCDLVAVFTGDVKVELSDPANT